jgi:hypothetical protein
MKSPAPSLVRLCLAVDACGVAAQAWAVDAAVQGAATEGGLSIAAVSSAGPAWWGHVASREGRAAFGVPAARVSIVELPQEGPYAGRGSRPRRALMVRSEMPQRMLRSMGVEANDCYTRFRVPTRVTRNELTGDRDVSIGAHVGFACRF